MANRNQNPFWNQDVIVAASLAFAGMAVLQSKLFPAASWPDWPLLRIVVESKLVEWWPLLLIIAGIALWVRKGFERRSHREFESVALLGGNHGTRKQN